MSPDPISMLTDAVLDEVATWQQRPLDAVYPLVFFDAIRVKSGMKAWDDLVILCQKGDAQAALEHMRRLMVS